MPHPREAEGHERVDDSLIFWSLLLEASQGLLEKLSRADEISLTPLEFPEILLAVGDQPTLGMESGDAVVGLLEAGPRYTQCELHADEEAVLLEQGARQADLWGINVYPDLPAGERVEYDSMINVRPAHGNRSRSVENPALRQRIGDIVTGLLGP